MFIKQRIECKKLQINIEIWYNKMNYRSEPDDLAYVILAPQMDYVHLKKG